MSFVPPPADDDIPPPLFAPPCPPPAPAVRVVLKKLKWKEVGDEDDWQLYWTDTSVGLERVMKLTKTQKINHFCGMLEVCRKKKLSNNVARLARVAPTDFEFHPQTYNLPDDMDAFMEVFKTKKKKTYILKPDAGCQVGLPLPAADGKGPSVTLLALCCLKPPLAHHFRCRL